MLKKAIIFTIFSIAILVSLCGCYDAKGIEDFYYIVALGIDKNDDGSIKLNVQTAHSSSSNDSGSSQSNEFKIYSVDCNTLDSGISILNNYLSKTINLSHCSAIVFSEDVARDGIREYINILENNTEVRPSCKVIVCSGSSYDVLNNVSESGEHFSSRLYDYILTSVDFTGYTVDSNFTDFFSDINNANSQAISTYTIVKDNIVQNMGAGIFKGDILVGTISPSQSIMHLILDNRLDNCSITIDNPFIDGENLDINLKQISNPEIDVEIINNTPFITINLFLECIMDSSSQTFDYTSLENISIIQDSVKEYISKQMKDYLYLISKQYNSDVVGFGEILPKNYLTTDELEKVHWNDIFQDSFFDVNIETSITSSHLFNKE